MSLPPLRGYQHRAVNEARRAFGAGARGVLVRAPTGAGKTRMAQEIALAALAKRAESRVLWLAHRIELIDTPAARLRETGLPVRVVRADEASGNEDARLVVASTQTLARRGDLPAADLVIFDEARHYSAPLWAEIARGYERSWRVGLDATPDRPLRHLFDAIVDVATDEELVAGGFLVPCRTIAPSTRVKHLARGPVEAWHEFTPGQRAIFFCASVDEAERVAREFTAAGTPAAAIHEGTDPERRREALRTYCDGSGPRVLTNVFCLTEGTDLPPTEVVAVFRSCSSESTWIQMIGRGRRPASGKERMTLLDPYGLYHELGLPEDERHWSIDGAPPRRATALPPAMQCPRCLGWSRGTPCPSCGATKPTRPAPRVQRRDMAEVRREAERHTPERRLDALRRWAQREREAGRSPWRARHIYKGVYGAFPDDSMMREVTNETR
ncbi:DEAD/DEAH box helicase family protein [Sorangium sp. So ce834]|uniref:DEAD/DEAH box helicase n=1 Tax=Sorangium sp. So ce834 TaxID=3133321 RepID=UPI003F62FA77